MNKIEYKYVGESSYVSGCEYCEQSNFATV